MVKRCLDIAGSLTALVLLSPVMLTVAALIGLTMGRPVLFRQPRPGRDGKVFVLQKFRTMLEPPADGTPVGDEDRLTPLGRMLRSTSLDELPGLFNVVRGDMSLVGPRPLRVEYLELYTPEQARRHDVRPGLTGWAQVNGRNAVTWEERFELDLWYVDNRSLLLDIRIMAMTLVKVVRREGISAEGHSTMPPFTGRGG